MRSRVMLAACAGAVLGALLHATLGRASVWLRGGPLNLAGRDLRGSHYEHDDLSQFDFGATRLGNSSFFGCKLNHASLRGSDMRGSVLVGTAMRGTDLRGADLGGCRLGVGMDDTDLRGASLRGADLKSAIVLSADFRGADIRGADLRSYTLRTARPPRVRFGGAQYDGHTLWPSSEWKDGMGPGDVGAVLAESEPTKQVVPRPNTIAGRPAAGARVKH